MNCQRRPATDGASIFLMTSALWWRMSSSGSVVYKLLAIILTKKVKQTYVSLNEEILVTSNSVHHVAASSNRPPLTRLKVHLQWRFAGTRRFVIPDQWILFLYECVRHHKLVDVIRCVDISLHGKRQLLSCMKKWSYLFLTLFTRFVSVYDTNNTVIKYLSITYCCRVLYKHT